MTRGIIRSRAKAALSQHYTYGVYLIDGTSLLPVLPEADHIVGSGCIVVKGILW
jgi:hypothetical protein